MGSKCNPIYFYKKGAETVMTQTHEEDEDMKTKARLK